MPEDVQQIPTPTPAKPKGRGFGKRKQLEQDIEHVTEEMYRRNKELADTNRTLSLLQTIDAMALEANATVPQVCERITEAICQTTEFPFVGLFTKSSHSKEELALFGWRDRKSVV